MLPRISRYSESEIHQFEVSFTIEFSNCLELAPFVTKFESGLNIVQRSLIDCPDAARIGGKAKVES